MVTAENIKQATLNLNKKGKLPEISQLMLGVIRHFAPMAKKIHPKANSQFVADKSIDLAKLWLNTELEESEKLWREECAENINTTRGKCG